MAELSARVKRAVEKLRSAEAMATLVSLKRPNFMEGRSQARTDAFLALGLYFEHSWTADGPVPASRRAQWQREMLASIESYVDTLYGDARTALAELIAEPSGRRVAVINPLSFARSDSVDLVFPDSGDFHVADVITNTDVPTQRITLGGVAHLRFLATDVPATGFRVFEIRTGLGTTFTPAASVNVNVIETDTDRVTLDGRGAVTSWIDKTQGNRQMIASIGGLSANDLGAGTGSVVAVDVGPVSASLRATSTAPVAHNTTLTLTRGSRRVALDNRISQNFGSLQSYGFSFALNTPVTRHEETGAIATARSRSNGGHYATQSERVDWLTLNHFAHMQGSAGAISLSNADALFFKLGNSGVQSLDENSAQWRVLAGGQVDGTALGIQNQGGDSSFLHRFALRAETSFDAASSMRFALEHQNPMTVFELTPSAPQYALNSYSLLGSSNSDVLLWALKPHEEGILNGGITARFWNLATSGTSSTLSLNADTPLSGVREEYHTETDRGPQPNSGQTIPVNFATQQIKTLRLIVRDGLFQDGFEG
jgi:alpha-mannosidase